MTLPDDPAWLLAVQFGFAEGCLQIEVDPGTDTIEVSFDPSRPPPLRHWGSAVMPRQMNQHYGGLVGQDASWWWILRNQQQYEDAFQIELSTSASMTTTLQYLAMASRLYLRHVKEAPMP
ncbi:hypothetical protein JKJ07_00445 [Actinoplanes sp. LDG1-01]|uniref:Uncharacterized protein n=1 Tax=Paractinoplanes lichenicola TaxID=2802976 RepID=A0ABS1VDM2_9ACTN|nr:hypothetical protein [Actinoplanes lichenicola]